MFWGRVTIEGTGAVLIEEREFVGLDITVESIVEGLRDYVSREQLNKYGTLLVQVTNKKGAYDHLKKVL